MVWCQNCAKHVPGVRPYDGALACDLCGRILENFNFATEVTFFKNAAGQGIASSDDAETRKDRKTMEVDNIERKTLKN